MTTRSHSAPASPWQNTLRYQRRTVSPLLWHSNPLEPRTTIARPGRTAVHFLKAGATFFAHGLRLPKSKARGEALAIRIRAPIRMKNSLGRRRRYRRHDETHPPRPRRRRMAQSFSDSLLASLKELWRWWRAQTPVRSDTQESRRIVKTQNRCPHTSPSLPALR